MFFKGTDRLQDGTSTSAVRHPQAENGDLALGRMAIKDFANARVLERLLMYERRIEHSLYKTILEFQRLHLIRKLDTGCEMPINQLTSYDLLCKTKPISGKPG